MTSQPVFPRVAFERGHKFVERCARDLDRARLAFTLGSKTGTGEVHDAAPVYRALSAYQNADGGFGQAIEPDLRTPVSTAIATSVGLQVLKQIDASPQHPMVRRAINWLLAKLDRDRFVWPIVTPAAVQAPHAPWWDFTEDMDASWNHYRYNPSADLFGALIHWRSLVPDEIVENMTSDFFWRLKNNPPGGDFPYTPYDLYCCVRLYDTAALSASVKEPLAEAIVRVAESQDPASMHVNYFELMPSKSSLLYPVLKDRFARAVENALATQGEDGGWHPPWSWAHVDANAWKDAEIEWSGVLTRAILETAHKHDIVE